MSAFKAHGGKQITYQGWADPVVSARHRIAYCDNVRALQGSATETDSFMRLFMVPGMDHFRGSPGADVFGNAGVTALAVLDTAARGMRPLRRAPEVCQCTSEKVT